MGNKKAFVLLVVTNNSVIMLSPYSDFWAALYHPTGCKYKENEPQYKLPFHIHTVLYSLAFPLGAVTKPTLRNNLKQN